MKLKLKLYLLFLVFLQLPSGCGQAEYCKKLVSLAGEQRVRNTLRSWVQDNIDNHEIKSQGLEIIPGGGMWPGEYWVLDYNFSWEALGFASDGQIRLVGSSLADNGDGITNIDSVFFGEYSRHGIIVLVAGANDFGVDASLLESVAKDISIVCMERD